MSQINWNDFSPIDGSGVSPKPAPPVGPVNWDVFSPAPEEPGLAARVKQGASRAFDSARTALTDDPNKIAQIAAEQARTALPQSDVQRKMAEEFAPYVDEANKAEGVVDNVKAWGAAGFKRAGQLASNPGETAKMIAEQLPNSLPGMAGGIAGAKLGAMAGTAVMPGVGTVVGGLAGGVLGGFAGGYGLEKGAAMQDQVQKEAQAQRIDLQDESAVARMVALKQPEFDAAAQRKGVGTAGTDALLNVATMGLSGVGGRTLAKEARTLAQAVKAGTISAADAAADVTRLQAANAARNTLGAKALRGAGVVGAEMGGEGLSEGVGQKLAYGNVDAGEVIDEALMGLGTGGAMALGSKAFNKAAGIVDQDATTQNIAAASDGLGALGPAFTTAPGAVDQNAAQAPVAQAPEAPDLSTTLGAGVPRDGVPFTRDIDTSGLAVEDRGAMERARAAMVDYEPGDTTPQWETSMGATAARQGMNMPAPEFDTGTLGLESQGRALTPSERMGINPAAGALSRAAAVAVDSGATPVQFLGATGRDLQARATGPGVTNESNVIDVQGRLVEDRAISTPRRLTDQQDGMAARAQGDRLAIQPPTAPSAVPALGGPVGADAARGGTTAVPDGVADGWPGGGSAAGNGTGAAETGAARAGGRGNSNPALSAPTNLREGLARMRARRQEAADAQTAAQSAPTSAPAVSTARPGAVEAAGAAPIPATTGVNREPSPTQAIQASAQPAQTGPAPAASDAGPGAQGSAAAPAPVGSGEPAGGLTNAATPKNNGAQAAPATGTQGAAQAAQAGVAPRPKNWRTSMLGATPVAKAMGIDPKGKRLAQVVAEIDARDTQAPATTAPAPAPGPVRVGRDQTPLAEGGKPFKTRKAAGDAKKLQPMMRVVTVPGGYALADKTPAQLAAEERAAKRLRTPRTSPAGEPVPAHAFIAAGGGLHLRHRNDLGVDGNPRIGNRRLFGGLNKGLSIEQATEMLVADGYLSEGASHNDAYALIKKSLSQPQYNADGIERIAESDSTAMFEDYMAAQEEAAAEGDMDPFDMADEFTSEELDDVGYTSADPALQAEVNALIAQADAMDIDTYAILEDIARTYANATQDQYNAAAREAIAAAIARGNSDGGSTAAQAAPAAEPAAEQGLNRPTALTSQAQAATESVAPEALELAAQTPAEAAARQDAQEQATKAEAAAKRAEDAAAKAEEDRKRIAQASVRAADSFELGQDPMDSLTGQGSIFDAPELPAAPATPAQPIQDAGQKIGGARKDRWKERGLNLDDLDAMTESEGAELATKANVWKPDYEAMSEASEPVTAAMVKTIYDQLAAKPKKNTPEGRRQYVQMMRIVRDVLTEADGPDEVKNAYQEIRKRAGLNTMDPKVKADGRELLFSVYKGRSDPFVFGFNELQRAKKLVADGFPAKADPWKTRLMVGRAEGGPGTTERGIEIYMERSAEVGTPLTREQILGGFYRVSTKDNKAVAFAASKADAEAAAATVYERDMKGKKDGKPEPVRPNLDELKRENLPRRIDRDVKADDFVNDLGFRGIEFGNWSAQDERQRILNMAYDGLMDLAEIMGVPPKAMSLNGTLGMAFGARGGGRFAAHYEPGKLVINMTKIRGGGSMAHEWAHAMDHYFGELDKPDAYTTQARGASGWYTEGQYTGKPITRMERVGNEWKNVEKMRLNNLRPEMAQAFDGVMRALFQKQVTKAEMVRSQELDLERTESLVQKEQDAEMKAMYQRMATNKQQALNELRGDPEDTMYVGRGRSGFASQAQTLSGKSVDGYWVRPTEMFARAFESWVFDRVTAMGAKSDYLVHGVEEDRFAGGNYKGNPYPTGEERARINAAFDKLANTVQTKETGKGVAMFSRAPSAAPTTDSNARNVATQLLVDGLKAKWARAPEIIIARNMQDRQIPQEVRDYDAELKSQGSDGEARGFIYKGKVYLLSDQLKGPEQIAEVLFHEVLGHYGLRGAFGESLTPILQQIGTMRRRDVVAKAREYGMAKKGLSDSATWAAMSAKDRLSAAEEVLAEMAQTQPTIGFVQRAISAIRNWLRSNVPGFKILRLTDADIIQAYILPARGFVTRSKETGAQSLERAMLAFSRVWHGSPHKFLQFDSSKIGTGEGAQAYGHGLYLAESKDVAQSYTGASGVGKASETMLRGRAEKVLRNPEAHAASDVDWAVKTIEQLNSRAGDQLYQVDLPDDQIAKMLDWDKPLSEQSQEVREAVSAYVGAMEQHLPPMSRSKYLALNQRVRDADIAGAGLYKNSQELLGAQLTSALLREQGIPGIRYLDGGSRGNGAGTSNYVIFPRMEKILTILDVNGEPVTGAEKAKVLGEQMDLAFSRTATDQTQTEAFKRWFKDSKAVDADGKPLRVFHGTGGDFSVFSRDRAGATTGAANAGMGFFFTDNADVAGNYARMSREPQSIMPVYLSLQNPLRMEAKNMMEADRLLQSGLKENNDGAIITVAMRDGGTQTVYMARESSQVKSTTGNNGNFDPANPDIRFSRATSPTASTAASPAWDAPVPTGFDDVIYKLQDKNIDLKRVVESITKSAGQVADSVNAYLKEELFHKRAAKRVEDFGARELKPLMNQMRLMGLGMEDVEEYLHARHAKEANAVIAQRNPGEPGLQDGGSGMTNQAADNYFARLDPAQRRKLEAVAKNVDAIIDKTRKLYVSYGLENQDVVDGWASMYQHYIPLMREDKEGGMGTGQGFSVKGKETKGRTGSTRKVVDILANIASQREKLIVRGEKNQVTQALVGLARANPNSDFWEVRSQAPTERVFDERTGTVVERPIPNFKSRDNVVVAKVQDSKGNVTEQMVVFNEDNPRAVRMAAAMKNLDAGNLEGLLGMSAKITRYFSAINTQYNPVFGVVNLVRDVQGAMVNLAATPLAGQQGKIARDTVSALAGIYSDIRKTRKGGQATSQWAQLWEQMQEDGGTTGYRELFTNSADRANNLKSILNPEGWMDSKWGKVFTADGKLRVPMSMAQKGASEIFGWLSDYNEAMENGVRLAAYKAALDMGMGREQAASLSKNLTVNFNRKGQVGMQAGAVYAFFNAAMQGTARIGQTLFDMDGGDISTLRLSKTGKAVVYGGVTLGVMQALALAGADFDEEDPPEFVRERSLIIPTGGKTYVSIPMPLGLHVIPGIGRHATEFALSGFDKPAKRALSVIGMFADAFNPIGNAGLSMQTLAPTALDPLVALTENKDWTGKPIARVSFNKALPGHTQWKDTATWYSKMAAEAINWVSGGNEYVAGALSPTPDQIDYLVAQVGGGVAREASKVFQAASTTVNGEELPTYKIPLLGRFAGNAASQASQGTAFYANLDKLNALETEIKGLRKDGRFGEAAQLARENPQAAMIPMANRAERDVQKLRRDKRELIATGATREEVRAKEAQITAVMARLNEAAARRKATAPE